jgi:diketogulonate reductase-like aldo/keto reductase
MILDFINQSDLQREAHETLAKHGVPLASNQVEYSLLHRQPEKNGDQATKNAGALPFRLTPEEVEALSQATMAWLV